MEKKEKHIYQKALIGALSFFIIIFLYANEFSYFSNTINVAYLVGIALVIGLMLGIYLSYRFLPRFKDPFEKLFMASLLLIVTMGTMPLVASLSNRLLGFRQTKMEPVTLMTQELYGESRFGILEGEGPPVDGFYLFFIRNNQLERVKTQNAQYRNLPKGATIELPIKKGLWGFDVVMV